MAECNDKIVNIKTAMQIPKKNFTGSILFLAFVITDKYK